jgi:hypothetical protein
LSYTAYLFEARSIQSYILDGGRLADQVAASNLLDALCRDPLQAALHCLNLNDVTKDRRNPGAGEIVFPRCGGGAFYAVFGGKGAKENAARLRDLWGIAAAAFCPGLEFVHALAEGGDPLAAVTAGTETLVRMRNRPPTPFPETSPLVRRSPRTGWPARLNDRLPEGAREWSDAATLRKRYARDGDNSLFKRASGLAGRFLPPTEQGKLYHWPRDLEPVRDSDAKNQDDIRFPFLSDNAYVAVIHADGNGLGQALMALRRVVSHKPEAYQRIFRGFSDCIEGATIAAAQAATVRVLIPAATAEAEQRGDGRLIMPARPIVLGGDDLTLIVRADLALPFTVVFLEAFEQTSAEHLADIRKEVPELDTHLTVCAGVVFIKSSQPFHLANHLAEVLCARAKAASDAARTANGGAGPKPASLALARITTSVLDEPVRQASLGQDVKGCLGALAYFLGGDARPKPRWEDLKDLTELLAKPELARGPVRQLFTLLGQDVKDAEKRYRRWREVLGQDETAKPLLETFDGLLAKFGSIHPELPFVSAGGGGFFTPLSDALALRAVGYGASGQTGGGAHE